MSFKIEKLKLNIKNLIYSKIREIENLEGATIVGSFTEKGKLDFNDIDLVIILKDLNNKSFNETVRTLKKINPKNLNLKGINKIKINTTFGPLKFNKKNTLVIHAMIYDKKGHIDHVKKSPFTCLDWERSSLFFKKHLKDIYQVRLLSFDDFFNSRRGIKDYLNDLKNNSISYRKYFFYKNKCKLINLRKKIDKNNKVIFYNHIVKNLICNFYKFYYQKNIKFDYLDKEKLIQVFGVIFFKTYYKNLIKLNKQSKIKYDKNYKYLWINDFIRSYYLYLKKNENDTSAIELVRHKKTNYKKEIFIGNKINPGILDKKKIILKKKVEFIFSSPLKRCLETSKLYFKSQNKIILDKNLKEINYGKAEGLSFNQLKVKFPEIISKWNKGLDPKFPGGENMKDIFERMLLFKTKLKKIRKSKIGIVSHNNFIRCFIGNILNIKLKNLHKINIPYFWKIRFIIINNKILLKSSRLNIYKMLKNIN